MLSLLYICTVIYLLVNAFSPSFLYIQDSFPYLDPLKCLNSWYHAGIAIVASEVFFEQGKEVEVTGCWIC